MSEKEKPKRRWFQFSLSTAVVLMLLAGGMLWGNFTRVVSTGELAGVQFERLQAGWPFVYFKSDYFSKHNMFFEPRMDWAWAFVDICCVLLLLIIAGSICEFIIRRLEARRR